MTPSISVSQETFSRLQKHAEPFIDTPETVINRAIDAFERSNGGALASPNIAVETYDGAKPPNLTHTRVLSVELCGKKLPADDTYWNQLLFALVRKAGEMGKDPDEVKQLVLANSVIGKKEDSGYRFFAEAGISVQGQDAVGAWKAIYSLASKLGLQVEVTFSWYDNPKAAKPGAYGRFVIGK